MPRRFYLFLILTHLAVALPLAYYLNIWVDEGSTLYTTEHGFLPTFHHALAIEKQAPLYFWLLSWWREINHSIFFARLFSIVCSIAAISFWARLARRIFDDQWAIWTTTFFALHPFLIWASLEIRVYSFVILLSVLLLKLFDEGYFEEAETRGKKQTFFILLSTVALYTNYYLGFLLVGCFFALLISRKRRQARRYFLQMLIVGGCFVPLLWAIKSQFSANTNEFQMQKSFGEGWRTLWNIFLRFALPTEIMPSEDSTTTAISFFRLWLARTAIAALLILIVKNRRKPSEKTLAFGAIALTISLFLLLAYALLGANYVEIRHAAVLFPPFVLFGGLLLREIWEKCGAANRLSPAAANILRAAAAIITGIFFVYATVALYPNLTKRGDWANVGAYLEQHEKPDQPIIVFTAFDALTLPYHYHGANRILPAEKFFEWGLEDEIGSANSWRRQTEFIISEIPSAAGEIWLLTNEKCLVGQSCEPLENFVQANYTVIEEKDFYKEKVRLLRKKTNE